MGDMSGVSFFLSIIGKVWGVIQKKKELKDRSNEIDYKTFLGQHLKLIEGYCTANADAKKEIKENGMIDVKKYEQINITWGKLISEIVDEKSSFRLVERYSKLITAYDENQLIPLSKRTKDREIEKDIILAYAQHLLEVKKYIVHFSGEEKELLLGYLKELEEEINKRENKK